MTPERKHKVEKVLQHRQNNLSVLLENVEDPHNISAVMRTCDAVGINEIFILNTKIAKHKKFGNRSSSSANKWITVHQFTELETCWDIIHKRFDFIICAFLNSTSKNLYELNLTQKTLLVFGNETIGISEELKNRCNNIFHIPQVGMIQSLNISVACAVSVYEAFRQKQLAGHYDLPQLNETEKNELLNAWSLNRF